jgi:hypothetical protein
MAMGAGLDNLIPLDFSGLIAFHNQTIKTPLTRVVIFQHAIVLKCS